MQKPTATLDFETYSIVNLPETGAFPYAEHPSTGIHIAKYRFPGDPRGMRTWREGEPFPDDLREWLAAGYWVEFHNALFEFALWNITAVRRYGWPLIPLESMSDTMARGLAMGLPASLANMATVMNCDVQKDTEGAAAMRAVMAPRKVWCYDHERDDFILENRYGKARRSIRAIDKSRELAEQRGERKPPRPKLYCALKDRREVHWYHEIVDDRFEYWHEFDRDPATMQRMDEYGEIDVHVQYELGEKLRPLSDQERRYWLLTMHSNVRGFKVDLVAAQSAQRVIDEQRRLNRARITEITAGAVTAATQVDALRRWVNSRGYDLTCLDKNAVDQVLSLPDVPDDVTEALDIRQQDGKSSTSKVPQFIRRCNADGCVRGEFIYHGAAKTGRLTSNGIQCQNLPSRTRYKWQDALYMLQLLTEYATQPELARWCLQALYGGPIEALSSALRSMIEARPNHTMYVADFSNIEGRYACWIAGEAWKLQAFEDYDTITGHDQRGEPIRKGHDLYVLAAAGILGVEPHNVAKAMRNALGKVSELSLQFQGGVGAFVQMAGNYQVEIGDYWETLQQSMPADIIEQVLRAWNSRGVKSGTTESTWKAAEAVKVAWRRKHPMIVLAWAQCQRAAVSAILNPGKVYKACNGKLAFGVVEQGGVKFLLQRLPSGRTLWLCDPRASLKPTDYGEPNYELSYMGTDPMTKQWVRRKTYGGDLFQSGVQGGARDIMMNGWENCVNSGFDILLNVHDELAGEAPDDSGLTLEVFSREMATLPEYAQGLPVVAEGYAARKFRKG